MCDVCASVQGDDGLVNSGLPCFFFFFFFFVIVLTHTIFCPPFPSQPWCQAVSCLRALTNQVIAQTDDSATLFRSNSLASKVRGVFFPRHLQWPKWRFPFACVLVCGWDGCLCFRPWQSATNHRSLLLCLPLSLRLFRLFSARITL